MLRGGDQLRPLERLAAEQGEPGRGAAVSDRDRAAGRAAADCGADLVPAAARSARRPRTRRPRALLAAVGAQPPPGLAEEYALCVMNAVSGRGDDPEDAGLIARAAGLAASLDRPLRLPFTVILWSLTGGPRLSADDRVRVQLGREPWGLALLELGLAYQELLAGRATAAETGFTRAWQGVPRDGRPLGHGQLPRSAGRVRVRPGRVRAGAGPAGRGPGPRPGAGRAGGDRRPAAHPGGGAAGPGGVAGGRRALHALR
ncbi:hypothetical protein LT493_19200 [Streptomyces tricolor]|nr:hypothetical protein [Streptomyces tricolor]